MNHTEIKQHLNRFSRPAHISPDKWLHFKKWAQCAWESKLKQMSWPFELKIESKAQLNMLQDEQGELIIPKKCLVPVPNRSLRRAAESNLQTARTLLFHRHFCEAEKLLAETELFCPDELRVQQLTRLLTQLENTDVTVQHPALNTAGANMNKAQSAQKRPARKMYTLRSLRRAVA